MLAIEMTDEFEAWLDDLRDQQAVAIIATRLDRVAEGNFGDAKPVGDGVSELRFRHGPGYRVYFTRRGQAVVLLLCGGDKGSQSRDIRRARAMSGSL